MAMNAILASFRRILVLEPSTLSSARALRRSAIVRPDNTEWKTHMKSVRNELQTLLGIKEIDALKLVTANKKLLIVPGSLVADNIKICLEQGFTKQVLLKYPFLLYEPNLEGKLKDLMQLPLGISFTLPFARFSVKRLHKLQLMGIEFMDRISDMQRLFKVPLQQACHLLSIREFLLWKPLTELEMTVSVLLEYNFTHEDLLKDLWVFKYSMEQVRHRLDFIKQYGVQLKTWMIRCPEEVLYKHLKRESENRDILGENSVTQYLSQTLDCPEGVAKAIIRKHPQLQNKSLLKIKLMIDLLDRYGFTPMQICRVPKVLLHSRKTTELRLKQLKALGKLPETLYIFTKSQKQYLHHIDNLEKGNTKSVNVLQ